MHIAVIPHSEPLKGGAFQYTLGILEAVATFCRIQRDDRCTLVVRSKKEIGYFDKTNNHWNYILLPLLSRERLVHTIEASVGNGWFGDAVKSAGRRLSAGSVMNVDNVWPNNIDYQFLRRNGVDWTMYTTPNKQAFEVGLPYVMPIFDLQHRLQPEFPEVSMDGEWQRREYLYRNGTRHAALILADSEVGKEDILNFYGPYGITEERVKVLPYVPPPYLSREIHAHERSRIRRRYQLPERYFFYPAQFWPHKNHLRLVYAVGRLKEMGHEIHIVLCGAHSGSIRRREFQRVMCEARRVKVAKQLHYIGYVDNDAMSALYTEAEGLVMPTFFGPTNIPVVEAWFLGCPVLTSDIRGIREQVGNGGLLVDPRSIEAIADGLRRLWEDASLRAQLAKQGTVRLAQYSQQNFCTKLSEIIGETNMRIKKERISSRLPRPRFATLCR